MENLRVFEINGFRFSIDSEGEGGEGGQEGGRDKCNVPSLIRSSVLMFPHSVPCITAPSMSRVKLTAKPVSKNWSMEKQGS